ncbi:hypothetical protein WJX82_009014 [Trebouxia sp. C0006]
MKQRNAPVKWFGQQRQTTAAHGVTSPPAASEHKVAPALKDVLSRAATASKQANLKKPPRLVAVSKTKPKELVQEAYDAGQRDFGENYVQEISEKASQLPQDIKWHFIGHLQSNKAKAVVDAVPNLAVVETVDSVKLANKLNTAVKGQERGPLDIYVQVNTSGEESKFGVEPQDCVSLAEHVHKECDLLRFAGLMTIGQQDYTSRPEDFQCLAKCREEVCQALSLQLNDVELSMGMSGDFEQATEAGSTNIRVGSTIFGKRDYTGSKPTDANEHMTEQAENKVVRQGQRANRTPTSMKSMLRSALTRGAQTSQLLSLQFEIVLDQENPDLYKWLTGQEQPPLDVEENAAYQALFKDVSLQLRDHIDQTARAPEGKEWVRGWDDWNKASETDVKPGPLADK